MTKSKKPPRTSPQRRDVPVKRNPTLQARSAITAQYVHTNHLGAPLFSTDASGAVVTPGAYAQPVFPGQIRTRADLYHNRYRDYDPTTGRYIQADPIGLAGGNNPYLYANGNPMRYVDPDGLWVDTVADVGFVFYDLYRIGRDNIFGNNCPGSLKENLTALGLDAGAIFVPFATGIGPASRVGRHIDDVPTPYDNLLKNARDKYPKKAEKYENHHITPKYLGGAKNGPTSNIDAAYHQEITNAFRREWRYGGGKPNSDELKIIMDRVYTQFPLIVF